MLKVDWEAVRENLGAILGIAAASTLAGSFLGIGAWLTMKYMGIYQIAMVVNK